MEQHIFSSEAAKTLRIGVSTLRKYAALLESKGYVFGRGANNGRIFQQNDLTLIMNMMEKIDAEGLTLDEAAEYVIGDSTQIKKIEKQEAEDFSEFLAQIKDLEVQQATLTEMNRNLVKQVAILTEKIEERERDKQLFQLIEESRKKRKRKGIALFRPLTVLAGKR
ncbi:hypothetical protein [Bacillus niameyensis]|uniref:hypothetical protein n=1 Tax=Bacillus niameyensis TaxID=1522308 RepID=UPI000780C46C|nr:hypothetical protein [Bacillus niameyensis]